MAQDVYLTPREIFRRLKIFEKRIPLRNFDEYRPLYVINELSEQSLTQEASAMILYSGLLGYKVQCRWEELSKRTGGDFVMDGNMNIKIRVSSGLKNNSAAVLATLAHEVCHAVMRHYRMEQDNSDENEYCTDLATIYMGFGRLIIDGYNTSRDGVNFQLGYLKYNIYTQTYNVINQARCNGIPLIDVADNLFLNDTLEVWRTTRDKQALLGRKFVDVEEKIVRVVNDRRNLAILIDKVLGSSVIQHRLTFVTDIYDEFSLHADAFTKYPIHAMSALYECELFEDDDNDSILLQKVAMVVEKAIANICRLSPDINPREILQQMECPHCGEVLSVAKGSGRIIKCTKCSKSCCVGNPLDSIQDICDAINAQSAQSKFDNEKKISEAYERGRRKGVESNAATAYQRGYNDAKKLYETRMAQLPFWLKWLYSVFMPQDKK